MPPPFRLRLTPAHCPVNRFALFFVYTPLASRIRGRNSQRRRTVPFARLAPSQTGYFSSISSLSQQSKLRTHSAKPRRFFSHVARVRPERESGYCPPIQKKYSSGTVLPCNLFSDRTKFLKFVVPSNVPTPLKSAPIKANVSKSNCLSL